MKEILINVQEEERRVVFTEDGRLEEFYIEREEGEQFVGNIYKGRVVNVTAAIQAAFVDIGFEKSGFLHISDVEKDAAIYREMEEEDSANGLPAGAISSGPARIEKLFKKDDEVLVQVMKGPIGTKGVRLTTNISIPGRHIVLLPNTRLKGVSRKIKDRMERIRFKKILRELKLPKDTGIIIRTAAGGIDARTLQKECKFLLSVWKKIQRRIKITKTPGRVHSELGLVLRTVRDSLTENITKVVVDSKKEYKRIRKFISIFLPRFKSRVELYREDTPIFEKYGLEKEIEKLFRRKLWLKKGGYIIIDRTEALVTIDVNSGKYVKPKDIEETAFLTNLEAAVEIGRQIRMRNIGGIIIIDFIDMETSTHQKLVQKKLKEAMSRDKAQINIYPFSPLGLVELTRQRVKETIARRVFEACPYCGGYGRIKSVETVVIEIKRAIQAGGKIRKADVVVHPDVYRYLCEGDFIKKWKKSCGVAIILKEDSTLHRQEYKIFA